MLGTELAEGKWQVWEAVWFECWGARNGGVSGVCELGGPP
jgi:hypothetical protein